MWMVKGSDGTVCSLDTGPLTAYKSHDAIKKADGTAAYFCWVNDASDMMHLKDTRVMTNATNPNTPGTGIGEG